MSRAIFDSFFPATSALLQSSDYTEWFYQWSFPAATAELCPEPKLGAIRNPVLGFHALVGVWIGWYGARRILLLLLNNNTSSSSSSMDRNNGSPYLWAVAFASYAAMNMAALPVHCLLPSSFTNEHTSSSYPEQAPWLWALDAFFTGLSSTAILLAVLSSTFSVKDWILVSTIGWMALLTFFQLGMTLPLELWYTVPTLMTGPLVWLWLILSGTTASLRTAGRLAAISCLLLGGVVLDSWFCAQTQRLFQGSVVTVWDLLTSPAMTFLGFNLAFYTLLLHLVQKPIIVLDAKQKKL